jgi:hypothetical protein
VQRAFGLQRLANAVQAFFHAAVVGLAALRGLELALCILVFSTGKILFRQGNLSINQAGVKVAVSTRLRLRPGGCGRRLYPRRDRNRRRGLPEKFSTVVHPSGRPSILIATPGRAPEERAFCAEIQLQRMERKW